MNFLWKFLLFVGIAKRENLLNCRISERGNLLKCGIAERRNLAEDSIEIICWNLSNWKIWLKKNYYLQHRIKKIAIFSFTKSGCLFANFRISVGNSSLSKTQLSLYKNVASNSMSALKTQKLGKEFCYFKAWKNRNFSQIKLNAEWISCENIHCLSELQYVRIYSNAELSNLEINSEITI